MIKNYLTLVIAFLLINSCSSEKVKYKIVGLWLVKKVEVGNKEMTPIARWMSFKSDSTQTSGNGWLQHSLGTWSLNENKLSITNTNGFNDTNEPFNVVLNPNTMTWSRKEDGQNVKIFLEKINKLPTSEGNKLIGLWERIPINDSLIYQHTSILYLRWDNTYVKHNEGARKKYGIYKIHGHKPELQLVNYGDKPEFKFYNFSVNDTLLTLKSLKGNEEIIYSRIHQFPQ